MNISCIAAAAALCLAAAAPVAAQQAGDWTIGLGIHNVDPRSDTGTLAGGTVPTSIDDNTRPTVTVEYFLRCPSSIRSARAAWKSAPSSICRR